MREVLSALFEGLTAGLGLPVDKVKEYAILFVIGVAAFIIAWRAVRWLYNNGIIRSRTAGSIAHWIIRLLAFFALWAYFYVLIAAICFIREHWLLAVCFAAVAVVSTIVIVVFRHVKRKKGGAASA